MSALLPTKRELFRDRVKITLELLEEREQTRRHWEYDSSSDSPFDESNYPTPLFVFNVAMQCAPLSLEDIETRRKQNIPLDDIVTQLYDASGQPEPSFQFAKFTPTNPATP